MLLIQPLADFLFDLFKGLSLNRSVDQILEMLVNTTKHFVTIAFNFRLCKISYSSSFADQKAQIVMFVMIFALKLSYFTLGINNKPNVLVTFTWRPTFNNSYTYGKLTV